MTPTFSRDVVNDGVSGRGENLILGLLAGVVAAVIGALVWMGITVSTGLHVGYVAIGVGALVGFAIRLAGNGRSPVYSFAGALLTLLGCLGGEILAVVYQGTSAQHDFFYVLTHVDLAALVEVIVTQMSPITYFIYAIGILEGYKLSVRR
jgi:hypothetical protein